MKYYLLDDNGFYLGVQSDAPFVDKNQTTVPINGNFVKFKFDVENWVEGATAEELEEIKTANKKTANELLKETDWYVIRFQETGKEIPQEILELRQQIRDNV